MSNKIIGKNYPLSFILVIGYINRLNPIHKHTFDLNQIHHRHCLPGIGDTCPEAQIVVYLLHLGSINLGHTILYYTIL
jgi:hypothetical protein